MIGDFARGYAVDALRNSVETPGRLDTGKPSTAEFDVDGGQVGRTMADIHSKEFALHSGRLSVMDSMVIQERSSTGACMAYLRENLEGSCWYRGRFKRGGIRDIGKYRQGTRWGWLHSGFRRGSYWSLDCREAGWTAEWFARNA